jgi:hypothetical protein
MDDKTIKSLINKSAYQPFKKIILKNLKNSEQIENEIRLIIDLNIVYYEIKISLESIIDYLVDRFKILDKDTLTLKLILHIYSKEVRECILKINKIIPNENLEELESEEKNKYIIKYLIDELIKCIFTNDIISMLLDLSENKTNSLINILSVNWKIIVILFALMLILLLIRKSYLYLSRLK